MTVVALVLGLAAAPRAAAVTVNVLPNSDASIGTWQTLAGGTTNLNQWLTGPVNAVATTSATYAPGAWCHLCGVVDVPGGTTKLYVNGMPAASVAWTGGTATFAYGSTPWRIGIALPGAANWMWPADGLIDDVRFYSRALSAQEALVLANNGFDAASGAATFTLAHAASVAGDVDLLGGNLSAAGLAITANASWRNLVGTGGFPAGGNTVTMSTTASQQIYGSTTFANLTKSVSAAATLTLPVYECQNVTGTPTLSGASGQPLSIRSSIPGSMATINPTGTPPAPARGSTSRIRATSACRSSTRRTRSTAATTGGGPGPGRGTAC